MKWLKIIVMTKATFSTIVLSGFVFVVCLEVDVHSQLRPTKDPNNLPNNNHNSPFSPLFEVQ